MTTSYKFGEVHSLLNQVEKAHDKVQFKNIFETPKGGVSILAFEAGQKLTQHLAPAEIMVFVLEGSIEFTMIDRPHVINAGEFILVGKDVPHSVEARADSKVMIIKVEP